MISNFSAGNFLIRESKYGDTEGNTGMAVDVLGMEYWEKLGKTVSIPKNQIICRCETVPDCCYIVKSGTVIGYEEQTNGNELIYFIMDRGTMVLEVNMLLGRPASVNFRTTEPSELIRITKEQLTGALESGYSLRRYLYASVANKFLDAMEELRQQRTHSAHWRLCSVLLSYGRRYGVEYDGKILINRNISLQILAGVMGVNRATTVRAMHDLRDMGLIENINGFYCIRSLDMLQKHQELLES